MAASIKLLVEEGYTNFSASRVASRARVSRGAQEHYFPKKSDLIEAVTNHVMRQAVDHAKMLARNTNSGGDPIEKFLIDSNHFFFRPTFRAITEIMIAARSDRALAKVVYPIVEEARVLLNSTWADTLNSAGYSREKAQEFIEMTLFLLRGIFFASTWLPYKFDRASVLRSWRAIAGNMLESKR